MSADYIANFPFRREHFQGERVIGIFFKSQFNSDFDPPLFFPKISNPFCLKKIHELLVSSK